MMTVILHTLDTTAAYAVDKTTIRTHYPLADDRHHHLRHIEMKSASTGENYSDDRTVFLRQLH